MEKISYNRGASTNLRVTCFMQSGVRTGVVGREGGVGMVKGMGWNGLGVGEVGKWGGSDGGSGVE